MAFMPLVTLCSPSRLMVSTIHSSPCRYSCKSTVETRPSSDSSSVDGSSRTRSKHLAASSMLRASPTRRDADPRRGLTTTASGWGKLVTNAEASGQLLATACLTASSPRARSASFIKNLSRRARSSPLERSGASAFNIRSLHASPASLPQTTSSTCMPWSLSAAHEASSPNDGSSFARISSASSVVVLVREQIMRA